MNMSTSYLTLRGLVQVVSSMLVLLVKVHGDDHDICKAKPEKRPDICPLTSMIPDGELSCTKVECNIDRGIFYDCRLENSAAPENSSTILTGFNVSQCTTEFTDSSNYLGLQFSWRVNTVNVQNGLSLDIAVEHHDYPVSKTLLNIDLTNHLTSNQTSDYFSTACIPLKIVVTGRNLIIKARTGPGLDEPVFQRRLSVAIDCSEIPISLKEACPAPPPNYEPGLEFLCENDTIPSVKVTFASGSPPGINNRKKYNVTIVLKETRTGKQRKEIKTLNATIGGPNPQVIFSDVPPGTYKARFAFNDAENRPCNNAYYNSSVTETVRENDCHPITPSKMPGIVTEETKKDPEAANSSRGPVIDGFLWIITAALALTLFSLGVLFMAVRIVKHKRNLETSRLTVRPGQNGLESIPDTNQWERAVYMGRFVAESGKAPMCAPSDILSGSLASLPETVDTIQQVKFMHNYLDTIHDVSVYNESYQRHMSGDSGWKSCDESFIDDTGSFTGST